MENEEKVLESTTSDKPCSMTSPKSAKRCATEPLRRLENTSTPYRSVKKRLVLECDKTPVLSPVLQSTSHASTSSIRMVSTTRMISITRGIQTIKPEMTNRYCQVSVARIRKPTVTVDVQTEECLLGPSQPPVILIEAASQTDEPLLKQTAVGTTQTESVSPVQQAVASCQTELVEESTEFQNDAEQEAQQQPQEVQNQQEEQDSDLETDENGMLIKSITTIVNNIAKQYGIDMESPAKEKKKKSHSKKKEIEQLQECLANKTCKAIASKVDKKMSAIIEKHMTVYGNKTKASRQRLMQWTKHFIRRQQQNREAASKPLRKTILVRRIVRGPKRPSVEEKAIQCVQELAGITVATQWQRQKPMVTKKKPVRSRMQEIPNKATPKTTSTDSKPCSAGTGTRRSMRQTKLSSYAKEQAGGENIQGRQLRKQQGEHSPKPSTSAVVPAKPKATESSKTRKAPKAQPNKKKQTDKKQTQPGEEIHIEETPSPQFIEREQEGKYHPYRSPPHYPTQCSKSTETSFLTPSKIRNLAPDLMDINRTSLNNPNATEHTRTYNPSVLLSPLERMYVEPTTMESRKRPEYNTFLVPLRSCESVPPTPSSRMVYMNRPERRVLLRSGPTKGGLVREKPPEVSIISSQQLYSQIGLAVEKALKNKSLPTLATMYGDPYIEVFNGCEEHSQQSKACGGRMEEKRSKVPKQQHSTVTDKFVCSSANDDAYLQESQQLFKRPPFHTERSPSLSPIIYQDENSDDEMIL